jgi:RHS repeat-associated protein
MSSRIMRANDRLSTDTYDANGNTILSLGVADTYDFENHMLTHGGVSVVYDGDGNRVAETVGSTTTTYLVDDKNPTRYSQVMDEIVNGSVTRTYAYGLQRISENQLISGTWTPSFYGYDGHSNVRFLANAAGTVTDTYTFDAFGAQIATTGTTANNFLYSGEWLDPNLSLYNLRARYYNMLTGRFETMDPGKQTCCALRASQVGNIFDPRTLHKYAYAANDPVNRIDPTGRDAPEYGFLLEVEAEVNLPLSLEMRATEFTLSEGV